MIRFPYSLQGNKDPQSQRRKSLNPNHYLQATSVAGNVPGLIIVFGTICLDRIRSIAEFPVPGGYVEVGSEKLGVGGEAANTAIALATWGAEVWLCGNHLGDDNDGAIVRSDLDRHGILSKTVGDPRLKAVTPVCDVYVTPDGDRTMFGYGFAAMEPVVVPRLIPFAPNEWFTAEPNMPLVSREVVRLAQKEGMSTYLMDFFQPDDPVEPGSVWQSSTDWVGTRGDVAANEIWLTEWTNKRKCFGILTDGKNGFVAGGQTPTGVLLPVRRYPVFPISTPVDTTGAGDCFRAGMLFGLSNRKSVGECLRFSAAAAALNCCGSGATEGLPSLKEIEALIASHPEIAGAYPT